MKISERNQPRAGLRGAVERNGHEQPTPCSGPSNSKNIGAATASAAPVSPPIAEVVPPDCRFELVVRGELVGRFSHEELVAIRAGIDATIGGLPLGKIVTLVARHYRLSDAQIRGGMRIQRFVWPRFVAMWLIRELCRTSYKEIGLYFGSRDHGTAVYGVQRVEERMSTEPRFCAEVTALRTVVASEVSISMEAPL